MEDTSTEAPKPQPRRNGRTKVIDATPTPEGFARMKTVMERALTGYKEDLDYIESFDASQLRWAGQRGALTRREVELIEQGLAATRLEIENSIEGLEEGIAELSK